MKIDPKLRRESKELSVVVRVVVGPRWRSDAIELDSADDLTKAQT